MKKISIGVELSQSMDQIYVRSVHSAVEIEFLQD